MNAKISPIKFENISHMDMMLLKKKKRILKD